MAFERMIKNAFEQSQNNCRFGDTIEEISEIQDYIKNAKRIHIPNKNGIKVEVLNQVLSEYGLPSAEILHINTNTADTSRIPALAKAYMALDQSDADLIIARGRLGIPGSGSLLIFIDNKGRILTAGTSPSHIIHKIDIFNRIIDKKSKAVFDYIESLNFDENKRIIVIGTYFTGVGIVKKLSQKYENIVLIDIYPHLEELLHTDLGGKLKNNVDFSSDLDLIYLGDIVIDTTGFGGINIEQSSKFDVDTFIIEDPVAEDNDKLLAEKNNIHERLRAVKAKNKAIIKTKGIDTKTSGTMTLTIGALTNLLNSFLEKEGVLYCACEMGFFEEIIFKQKDIGKFIELTNVNAFKVSTINPFDLDEMIREEISKIITEMI